MMNKLAGQNVMHLEWLAVISERAWESAVQALTVSTDILTRDVGTDVHLVPGNPLAVRFNGRLSPRKSWQPESSGGQAVWDGAKKECLYLRTENPGLSAEEPSANEVFPTVSGTISLATLMILRVVEAKQNNKPIELALHSSAQRISIEGCDDFSISIETEKERARFRIAAQRSRGGVAIAIRKLPSRIMRLEECGFAPDVMNRLKAISIQRSGLVLLVGTVNSGKSSTLAAMINHANRLEARHVITIEDPTEYFYAKLGEAGNRALVQHREIGSDVADYENGLRQSLRGDAECILVGEIRTKEAMQIAIHASQAGHLVYATMHAANCVDAIDIIGSFFPPEERQNGLLKVARSLTAIVYQALAPSAASSTATAQAARKVRSEGSPSHEEVVEEARKLGGDVSKGRRVLLYEYLENNQDVRQLIRQFAVDGPMFRFAAFDELWGRAPHRSFLTTLQSAQRPDEVGQCISKEVAKALEIAYSQASLAVGSKPTLGSA